jgi:hypothetical protein
MNRLLAKTGSVQGVKILEFFSRQGPGNPIERLKTGLGPTIGSARPFKKFSKN